MFFEDLVLQILVLANINKYIFLFRLVSPTSFTVIKSVSASATVLYY